MERIDITRYYKGLKISMCVMSAYSVADMDYEFSISGNNLPMVQIGKISAYCDGGKLLLDEFENVIGSEIYVPLTYGRVYQDENDVYPSCIQVFEVGINEGIYEIEEEQYKILNYDKNEIISVLSDMAKECQKLYIKSLDIKPKDIKIVSKILQGKEGTYGIRYYKDKCGNLVFGDDYGFGLFEIDIKEDMTVENIAILICNALEIEFKEEDYLDRSIVKCCGTCVEFIINKDDGYSHCGHFGTPVNMFNAHCRVYSEYNRNIIEEILEVEDFTL